MNTEKLSLAKTKLEEAILAIEAAKQYVPASLLGDLNDATSATGMALGAVEMEIDETKEAA